MYIKNTKSTLFISKSKNINDIPTLFIHGFTGSSKSWSSIRSKLSTSTIAVDIPGYGKSIFNDLSDTYFFKDFSNEIIIGVDHEMYAHTVKLTENNKKALALDFD